MKKYLKASLFILAYLFIYFFMQTVYYAISVVIYQTNRMNESQGQFSMTDFDVEKFALGQATYAIIFAAVGSAIIYYLISKLRKENMWKICNFNKIKTKIIIPIVLAGLFLQLLIGMILEYTSKIIKNTQAFDNHADLMNNLLNGNIILSIIAIGIIAPIIEELIFRGLIQNELRKIMPLTAVVVVQAVLFGIYHMNIVQGIYAFVLGVIFSLIVIWFKSIWGSIIMHATINTSSVLISKINEDSISDMTIYLVVAGMTIIGLGSLIYLYKNRIKIDEEKITEEQIA